MAGATSSSRTSQPDGLAEREDDAAGDVGGVVEVLVGRRLERLGAAVEEARAHAAGDEQRDAHAVAQLGGERAREADDAELARAVGGGRGQRAQAERGGDGDDAAAGALERRQRGAHDGGRAEQVDHHDAVPGVGVDVEDVAARVGAGGGDHAVEAAVLLRHGAHGRLGVARAREVDLAEGEAVGGRAEVEHDRRAAAVADRGGHGRAEPRGPAGDEHRAERAPVRRSRCLSGHGPPPSRRAGAPRR